MRLGLVGALLLVGCGRDAGFERGDAEAQAHIEVALERVAAGDRDAALVRLEETIARYPSSYEARAEYARVAATSGQSAQAIETYELLFEADPSDLAAARYLSELCLFVGQLERAERAVGRLLLAEVPTSADLVLAARLAHERGDLEAAEELARRALEQAPDSPEALHQLARTLLDVQQPPHGNADFGSAAEEASALLERALELDPGRGSARFALGTLLLQADRTADGQAQLDLARLIEELGRPDFRGAPAQERVSRARQASRELPKWSRPWIELARAQLELGQPRKAEQSLERAMLLPPDDLEAYKLRYASALARGAKADAETWLSAWRTKRDG